MEAGGHACKIPRRPCSLIFLFLSRSDRAALLLRLDAAGNGLVRDDDDGLLVIHDLDERLADLHGQFFAVFIEGCRQ